MSCPICDKPTEARYKPFCSKRCADVDLAKWLSGSYALPSTDPHDFDALSEAMEEALSERGDLPDEKLH